MNHLDTAVLCYLALNTFYAGFLVKIRLISVKIIVLTDFV